jgi:hypothetical protein
MSPPAHRPRSPGEALQQYGDHVRVQCVHGPGPVEDRHAEPAAPLEEDGIHQLPSGMMKLAPSRTPEGQRVVTVLVLV